MAALGQKKVWASPGFYIPEEAAPHMRTFMQWPVSTQVHPEPEFLRELQQTIALIANTIAEFEPVVMLMKRSHAWTSRRYLSEAVEIWDVATEDLWARDSGPVFAVTDDGKLAITQFNFNGWGQKQKHRNDARIAQKVAERLGLEQFDFGLVGEPGGVESDGEGTLIAHESSWINPNRNRGARSVIEARLLQTMAAEKVIWAPGIAGADITDYHIDSLARFIKPGTILIQMPDAPDPKDPWSIAAFETFEIFRTATDANGSKLELITIPEPQETRITTDDFVASYVNYYVCNGAVIAAQFGDPRTDLIAAQTLGRYYPGREIVMLNVDPLGEVGGGIHCATQQQPKIDT